MGTWQRYRPIAVLAIGAAMALVACVVLLFGAREVPVAAAASLPSYTPTVPSAIVARVPKRDPRELQLRGFLRAHPERIDIAVELAHAEIQRARSLSDPRYLGRAQAMLARWWDLAEPPPDVLLLRATIRQSLHDFTGARADLDRMIALRPNDAQALLTRAVVATVSADYVAARDSCARVTKLVPALVAVTCMAQVDGVTGNAAGAYAALSRALEGSAATDTSLREWATTALAELAIIRGDDAAAIASFRAALELDPEDAYARAGLADELLVTGHPAVASALLAGREVIDNLLVRRAIAEHAARGTEASKWERAMRDRIAAAAERGDRIHMREEARFDLEVLGDAPRALVIALDDWGVQKELADARLVAAAAKAAGDPSAADPVRTWARANHVEDVQLGKLLGATP